MHKLVILIEPPEHMSQFNELWSEFLHQAEEMPGLLREATSRVDHALYGNYRCHLIHEFFFTSIKDIREAMRSPAGQNAGELLQRMTGGRMTLLIADHKEDDIENLRKYRRQRI